MKARTGSRLFPLAIALVASSAAARYLSPEPLLQDPNYVARMAAAGYSVPTYSYALNNPVRYVDRNGLDVTNNTSRPLWVKPGDPDLPLVELPPGETYRGDQDGFTDPTRPGRFYKNVDHVNACVNDKGDIDWSVDRSVPWWKRPYNWVGQAMSGGLKDARFVSEYVHPDWRPLYLKSEPGRPGPFVWP